jgi:hypothetical protein
MSVPSGRRSWRGRAPRGLLGMLALVLAAEGFVARHHLDVTSPTFASWSLSARAAGRDAPGRDVLFLGDSLVKHGLVPRVFEARSGRTAYNLSVCAAQAPMTYFLLRRALDAGARPTAIVVDFKPGLLAGGPECLLSGWQEFVGPREWLDFARTVRSPSFLAAVALGRLVPTVRARFEIRAIVLAALRGRPSSQRASNLLCRRQWRVNDGANVAIRNPFSAGAVGPEDHQKYLSDFFWCHRVNHLYLERFFALARSRGIPVYWLLPPFSPPLQAHRDRSGTDAKLVRFIRSLQAEHPNLTVLDARHSGYDRAVFVDPIHLDGRGAVALSASLADHFRRGPSPGSRWVALAPYRPTVPGVPLEDVEQSRVAVELGGGGLRR